MFYFNTNEECFKLNEMMPENRVIQNVTFENSPVIPRGSQKAGGGEQ